MAKADLHIHTIASDGQMSSKEVVQEAAKLNLSAIAITDHDTVAGVEEAQVAAREYDVEIIPGVEFTTAFGNRECHLLAYDFDLANESLRELINEHQRARISRAKWIIGELQKKGLDLDIHEVLAEARGLNVGRPHIAEVLRKKGYIASTKEAFMRYLSDENLGTIKNYYRDFAEVIRIVKQSGGVAVIAHPGRLYNQGELEAFVKAGIDGIEAVHPSHNYEIQKETEAFAERHHLLCTGGSDFHGNIKEYYRHFGTLAVPENCVNKIKALAERRKGIPA